MADTVFTYKAMLDASNVLRNLKLIQAEFTATGRGGPGGKAEQIGVASSRFKAYQIAVRQAKQELQKLLEVQKQFGSKDARGITDAQTRRALKAQQAPQGRGRGGTPEQVSAAIEASRGQIALFEEGVKDSAAAMDFLARQAVQSFSIVEAQSAMAEAALLKAQGLTAGRGTQKNLQTGLVKGLDEEIATMQDQLQQLNSAAAKQGTGKQEESWRRIGQHIEASNQHRKRALDLTHQISDIESKIAGSSGENRKERDEIKRLTALRAEAQKQEEAAKDRARRPEAQQRTRTDQAGTSGVIEELKANLQRVQQLRDDAFDPDVIAKQFPALQKQVNAVKQTEQAYHNAAAGSKEQLTVLKQLQVETRKLEEMTNQAIASRGLKAGQGALNPEQLTQNLAKMRPGIDRLFEGIFSDMSRRFVATLQFTISAAIIFGAQRLAKEFIQAAIEVERAFADIESALEYDIDAEKGSLAFKRQVEGVRIEVLKLANDFNILPSEANEAAYVMVSRFNDVTNAMIALKAQLLATKVSGIEQGEVLRALTATAEGFAAAVFEVNDGLSLQAKLTQRETIAAKTYGKALDLAVQIQQKYGVETEDTLEGTARATEVFRQMGFTMEETAAIVAGTSRQLGQTGQQVAERLNRSLGQLTDPKIREALLDLASANSTFNLSISDFGSGADAWKKIVDQYERLERADPQVARQILQIVGQRRELEAVAAALGTADLQKDIVAGADSAAGAAEKRFLGLSRTMEEIMMSIAAQFQSLSQSFQTLGGLSSIKILLLTLESVLTVLGRILDMIKWVIDGIDGFLGLPVASEAAKWLLVAASVATVLRMVIALKRAYADLAAFGILRSIGGFLGGGTAGGIKGALGVGATTPAMGVVARNKSAYAIKGAASSVMAALATPAGAFAAAAAAAVVVGLSLKSLSDRAEALNKSLVEGGKSMTEASVAAQRQAEAQNLSAEATERLILLQQLAAAQAAQANAPSGAPGILDWVGSVWQDIPQPLSIASKGGDQSSRIASTFAAAFNPQNEAGSSEQWAERIDKIQNDLIAKQVEHINEANRDIWSEVDYGSLGPDAKDEIRRAQQGIAAALKRADDLRSQASDPDNRTSQAERDALNSEAGAIVAAAVFKYEQILNEYGTAAERLETSTNEWKRRLGAIDTNVALGLITKQQGAAEARESAAGLLANSLEYRELQQNDEADEALNASRDAELQAMDLEKAAVDDRITATKVFHKGRDQIRRELEIARSYYQSLAINDPRWAAALAAMLALEISLHEANLSATRAQYDHAVAMAKNFDESIRARKNLLQEIIRQIGGTRDDDEKDALQREADKLEQDIHKDEYDNRTKVLQSQKRLSGPIFSRTLAIQAEVIGQQRIINSEYASYAEKLEAQVRLKELYAQQQTNELERLKAVKLATLSVRDSMSGMLVELSALKRASELAAIQFGTASAEYANSLIAIQDMEKTIIDATLELESVNRQLSLDFDVTDPLHAAEEAFIKTARALQIPDLGDAEKAAAELEHKTASANLLSAQYADQLFNLRFQHESGAIGTTEYVNMLKGMLAGVDTATHAGKQLWIQINGLIEGMTSDLAGQAFNIPGQIRIPTLFEVRRAVQAEALGVNYMDNRQQDINVYVSDDVQLSALMETIAGVFDVEQARFAPGGAGITLGI